MLEKFTWNKKRYQESQGKKKVLKPRNDSDHSDWPGMRETF